MCEGKRHFLWTIGIFACLLLNSFSYAGKVETIVVDSGYVVAYGKYIPPPYKITLKQGPIVDGVPNDTIFINNVRYFPPVRKPKPKKEIPEKIRERGKMELEILRPVRDSINNLIEEYGGLQQAKPYIENFLRNTPNVENWEIGTSSWSVKFKCEYKGKPHTFTHRVRGRRGGKLTKEEQARLLRESTVRQFKALVKGLKKSKLRVFMDGTELSIPATRACQWLSDVKSVLEKSESDSLKKELLLERELCKKDLAEEILGNKEEWEKLKLDEEQNE